MSITTKKPSKGVLLISEPFLSDPNFKRTVVLVTEHDEAGSVGFILNRPLQYRLNDILEDFPNLDAPVYAGGPVKQDSLHFLHRIRALAEEGDEVAPGVYWGGNFEKLKTFAAAGAVNPQDIRFFIGYSGWGPQQLETEMQARSWILSDPKQSFTFENPPRSLWRETLKAMGGKFKILSNYPENPMHN